MAVTREQYWNQDHEERMGLIDKVNSQYSVGVERSFSRGSRVADVGGGTGGDAIYFLKNGHSVTIFDISPVALEYAKDRASREGLGSNLETVQVDLSEGSIPAPDNSFDEVYARLSTHYFTFKRTGEIFKEFERILAQGGSAHVSLKSPVDVREMGAIRGRAVEIEPNVFDDAGMIKSRFTVDQLIQVLSSAGVSNFEVKQTTEKLIGEGQTARTGTSEFVINEVIIRK